MNNKMLGAIFSLSGASISIGVLGFVSSAVSLFIDVNSSLSIKWFLFVILLLVSFILILLKLIYDLSQGMVPPERTSLSRTLG